VTDVWGCPSVGSGLASLTQPEPWMEEAACQFVDPYLWHPRKGDAPAVRKAKAICRECPVLASCRDYSLRRGEMHGVWGAMGEKERRTLIAARNRELKQAAA
jgi:WhiB family redox-sensing transcriptional regulator